MTSSMRQQRRCAMAAKLRRMVFVLVCAALPAQGVQAENCRLSLSQPRVDYGVIRSEASGRGASVVLGTRTLSLSVLCVEPSAMALRFVGAVDGQGFRFGPQGRFRVSLKHAQVDGRAVEWETAHLPGERSVGLLLPGQVLVARVAGTRLTAQVDIDTDLLADALQVRSQTELQGQGRFELVSPAVPRSR